MNLYEKLSQVQKELKAPKSQYNKFGGYNYRNCEDILESAKPLLDKYKLTLCIYDELVLIGERYYIKACAVLRDAECDDVYITNTAYAREDESKKGMDLSQVTGAASSYARKYALNGLFLIDDTKDADSDEYHNQTTDKKRATAKVKTPSKEIMLAYLEKVYTGDNLKKLLEKYNVESIAALDDEVAATLYQKCIEKAGA